METVEIEIGADGRIVGPVGVKLRLQTARTEYPLPPPDRQARLDAIFEEINADADQVPLKPWPENDPIVEKYRRKGLID